MHLAELSSDSYNPGQVMNPYRECRSMTEFGLARHFAARVSCEPGGKGHWSSKGHIGLRFQHSGPALNSQRPACSHKSSATLTASFRTLRSAQPLPENLAEGTAQDTRTESSNSDGKTGSSESLGKPARWARQLPDTGGTTSRGMMQILAQRISQSRQSAPRHSATMGP